MKNAIIIHGSPSEEEYKASLKKPAEKHWLPWIKEKLEANGIASVILDMPEPYNPEYKSWKDTFEQLNINEETILIGHSSGAGFLVRWLSENKIKVGKLILVAPWLDPDKELNTGMFDFEIDKNLIERAQEFIVFYSTDDDEDILKTVQILKENFKQANFKEFSGKGHFCFDDLKTEEFRELLEEAIK